MLLAIAPLSRAFSWCAHQLFDPAFRGNPTQYCDFLCGGQSGPDSERLERLLRVFCWYLPALRFWNLLYYLPDDL
jgi:hypothetical protein